MSRTRVDHAQAVDELHEALTARLAEMTTSEDWLNYLSHARRFHRYSPQNQMLLALQGAEGAVAGYRNWQRIPAQGGGTCQVAKGENGLRILAPMKGRSIQTDEITGEEVTKHFLRGFRTVKVFHQGQLVAPPDIGDENVMPKLLTGENRWQHVWSAVTDQLAEAGFDVKLHSRSPLEKWNGATNYTTREVLVGDDLAPGQQLKTLLHEWGHVTLDHETRSDLPRDLREVEAESVAFLLGQTFGLDTEVYSVPYIAGWAGGNLELIESTAQQVLTTTKQLVSTLEHDLGVNLTPDVLDHALPEADTNVVNLPARTSASVNEPSASLPSIQHELFEPPAADGVSPLERTDTSDAEFLRALGQELEPDQAAALVTVIYRADHARRTAQILAESGRTALQTARIMERFGLDHNRIHDALAQEVSGDMGNEIGTLYAPEDVAFAIETINPSPTSETPDVDADALRSEKIQDMRMLQRVVRTAPDARLVVELADSLDIEPGNVIRVCEASNATPALTVAVAVGVHGGDGAAAMNTLKRTWPDIAGGWESYAQPSMISPAPTSGPALVADPNEVDPILEMFAEWDEMANPTPKPAPEPVLP